MFELVHSITSLPSFHMWCVFTIIVGAIIAYSKDDIPMEIVSIVTIGILILFFYFFPMLDSKGVNQLGPDKLFLGFSNSALITVMCMLVVGQAVVMTGSLNALGHFVVKICGNRPYFSLSLLLCMACFVSAFMNNTPVVVVFIPILAAVAKKVKMPASSVMIPLAYAASLGGITTLIGTSTNLLISQKLVDMGYPPIGFFEFFLPGIILCVLGMIYVVGILPRLLPDRSSLTSQLVGEDDRQFVAEIEIARDSDMVGMVLEGRKIAFAPKVNVKMVQRGEHAFLPPFEEPIILQPNDVLVVSATREALSQLVQNQPNVLLSGDNSLEHKAKKGLKLAEVIVAPGSRMVGQDIEQIGLRHRFHTVVLGIQRHEKIIRAKMSSIRLQAGDVLLVLGPSEDLATLATSRDIIMLESTEDLPNPAITRKVNTIFFSAVGLAAFEVIPIEITSFVAASLIVLTGCLNIRQACRALDRQVYFVIAASYMLSLGLQKTGGAEYIADAITQYQSMGPLVIMTILFFVMILFNEIMSNNATGLLFIPIAVNIAQNMGIDVKMFIWAVIFAGSCSFATPIGYQTNMLVMGPGHYKFSDYMKAGIPLNLILWGSYTIFAYFYFNLGNYSH